AALAAFVRAQTGRPWSEAKRWIETGKGFVDGERAVDAGRRLPAGGTAGAGPAAAPPPLRAGGERRVCAARPQVRDPPAPRAAGAWWVRSDEKEAGTAMDLVRDAWRGQGKPATSVPLHVVHRIDKDTSGLLVFAKTKRAETGLAAQLRAHAVARLYVCVAHGD